MAEKELRRMSREELVEIIYAMQQSQHQLEQQNEELRARLDERTLKWEQAGSLAEAALSLNHVFEDAQAAADQYLASLKAGETDARAKADELTAQAQRDADKLLADARREADDIVSRANREADRQWELFRRQVRRAVQVSPELAALLQKRRPREDQE